MSGRAKALVLDFGGVVTKTLFETHQQSEAALNLPRGSLKWRGPFDPEGDRLWREMLEGKISERDYWLARTKEVSVLTGRNWTKMKDLVVAVRSGDPMEFVRPECLNATRIAKEKGIRLAILSNELDLFYGAEFRKKLPFLANFNPIIDATYTKILKPDPRAYALVTEACGLDPEDCVFVDDQKRNCDGAKAFGMKAVQFDVINPEASYEAALALLGVE